MLNPLYLQELSFCRLLEAQALHNNRCWHGAYYLAGYSVELALKSVVAKNLETIDLATKKEAETFVKTFYTHNLSELLKYAGLPTPSPNTLLDLHWTTVCKWSEQTRYQLKTEQDAWELLQAITDPTFNQKNQSYNGVLPWITSYLK